MHMEHAGRFLGKPRVIAVLILSLLAACADGKGSGLVDAKPNVFIGWVRFTGEFMLYETRDAMEEGANVSCISGALPLPAQRDAMHRFNRTHVIIYGHEEPWVRYSRSQVALLNEGAPIENQCSSVFVIFATKIVPFK